MAWEKFVAMHKIDTDAKTRQVVRDYGKKRDEFMNAFLKVASEGKLETSTVTTLDDDVFVYKVKGITTTSCKKSI